MILPHKLWSHTIYTSDIVCLINIRSIFDSLHNFDQTEDSLTDADFQMGQIVNAVEATTIPYWK